MTTKISKMAIVQTKYIGDDVRIQEFAVVRENVHIGHNVIIHPHVVVESGATIGDNVEIFPGTYIGKVPKGAGAISRLPKFDPYVKIGASCSIGPNAVIFYDVEIGNNTLIGDGASVREKCRIGSFCIISRYVTINYNTQIGNHTKVMDLTHLTGNSNIGNNVFISVSVGMTNDNLVGREGYDEARVIGPQIEDNAVVGVGASILPAVRIGRGATIGAGAVVTKDVPDNAVVMGIPAKIVRYNSDK